MPETLQFDGVDEVMAAENSEELMGRPFVVKTMAKLAEYINENKAFLGQFQLFENQLPMSKAVPQGWSGSVPKLLSGGGKQGPFSVVGFCATAQVYPTPQQR